MSISALCFREVEGRLFALSFGYGRYLLRDYVYEKNFGLRTALNLIDEDAIKKMSVKNFSGIPKDASIQSSKYGNTTFFDIDKITNLLKDISGKVDKKHLNESLFYEGSVISGADSLSVSIPKDIETVDGTLSYFYKIFQGEDYKEKGFWWVGNIESVGKDIAEVLDKELVKKVKEGDTENIWASVPEMVDWSDVSGFKYQNVSDDIRDDIDFRLFLENEKVKEMGVGLLRKKNFHLLDSNGTKKMTWSVYKCLNAEIDFENKKYILNDGEWFNVDKDFVEAINKKVSGVEKYQKDLQEYIYPDKKRESDYNEKLALEVGGKKLDGVLISHGGGNSKLELCDVLTRDALIHTKIYSGSGVLSHLFNQGYVSAETLMEDATFRKKVNEKMNNDWKVVDEPQSVYSVVFVILTHKDGELRLPFFARVALVDANKKIQRMGYGVSWISVKMSKK